MGLILTSSSAVISAKSAFDSSRPALNRLMADAKQRRFDVIAHTYGEEIPYSPPSSSAVIIICPRFPFSWVEMESWVRCGRVGYIADLDYAPRRFGSAVLGVAALVRLDPQPTVGAPEDGFVPEEGVGVCDIHVVPNDKVLAAGV